MNLGLSDLSDLYDPQRHEALAGAVPMLDSR